MQKRIDDLIRKHNDVALEHVIQFAERLGVAVAFMCGSVAIMKFHNKLIPGFPGVAFFIGIILFVCSFYLVAWIGFGGWWRLVEVRGYRLRNHLIGVFLVAITSVFVTAGVFAAIGV